MALRLGQMKQIGNGWSIMDGPSKFDLMLALFAQGGEEHPKKVYFRLASNGKEEHLIGEVDLVEREHPVGSGDDWTIEGRTWDVAGHKGTVHFQGRYMSNVRKGLLRFYLYPRDLVPSDPRPQRDPPGRCNACGQTPCMHGVCEGH